MAASGDNFFFHLLCFFPVLFTNKCQYKFSQNALLLLCYYCHSDYLTMKKDNYLRLSLIYFSILILSLLPIDQNCSFEPFIVYCTWKSYQQSAKQTGCPKPGTSKIRGGQPEIGRRLSERASEKNQQKINIVSLLDHFLAKYLFLQSCVVFYWTVSTRARKHMTLPYGYI